MSRAWTGVGVGGDAACTGYLSTKVTTQELNCRGCFPDLHGNGQNPWKVSRMVTLQSLALFVSLFSLSPSLSLSVCVCVSAGREGLGQGPPDGKHPSDPV